MKHWRVELTPEAKEDLDLLYEFIIITYNDVAGADRLLASIIKKCQQLSIFPEYAQVKYTLNGVGVRFAYFRKHLIIYTVNKGEFLVSILRVVWSGRDLKTLLSKIG